MENLSEMASKGNEIYKNYIQRYGKEPEIKNVVDAGFYGLISLEEMFSRIEETERTKRRISLIIGYISLMIFLPCLILTLFCMVLVHSHANVFLWPTIVCILGIVFSVYLLKKP